jgi:hypothetical protein
VTVQRSEISHICSSNASLLLPQNSKFLYDFILDSLKFVTRNNQKSLVLKKSAESTRAQLFSCPVESESMDHPPISHRPAVCSSPYNSSNLIGLIVLNRLNLMVKNPWRIIRWPSIELPERPPRDLQRCMKPPQDAKIIAPRDPYKSILPESYKTYLTEVRRYMEILKGEKGYNSKYTGTLLIIREQARKTSIERTERIRAVRLARICQLRDRCNIRKRQQEATIQANDVINNKRELNIINRNKTRDHLFKQIHDTKLREHRRNQKSREIRIRKQHDYMTHRRDCSLIAPRKFTRLVRELSVTYNEPNPISSFPKEYGNYFKDINKPTQQTTSTPTKVTTDIGQVNYGDYPTPSIVGILPCLKL